MKIKPIHVITACAIWLAVYFFLFQRGQIGQMASEKMELLKLMRSGSYGMERIADKITATKALQLELDRKQGRMLVENEDLRQAIRELHAKVEMHTVTVYDSVILPVDSAQIIRSAQGNSLKLPFKAEDSSRWLSFKQYIDTEGRNIYHDITTRDSLTFHLFTAKRKLKDVFKPRETKVSISAANPYTKFEGATALTIKQKRNFVERPIVTLIAGFILGTVLFAR